MSALAVSQNLFDMRARPILRDYQVRIANETLALIQRGLNPAVDLPTAGGKGLIIAAVTEVIEAHGYEVWAGADKEELVRQISNHYDDLGIEHGVIAPWAPLTDCPTQVFSVQTVRSRIDRLRHRLRNVRLIIEDECHHSPANSRSAIRELCPNARFLGLSASMFRLDGKPLGSIYNAEVRGPSIKELEDRGFISRVRLIAPPARLDLSKIKKSMGDFSAKQLDAAVNTEEIIGAAVIAYAKYAGGLPTLAFCPGVASAASAAKAFAAAGWGVAVLESKFDHRNMVPGQPRDRAGIIAGLASGRVQVVFQVGMAGEGTDIPVCSAGIDMAPTLSTGKFLQAVGRTKRVVYASNMPTGTDAERLAAIAEGPKPHAIWIDLAGNWSRHGMPNADRIWSLAGGLKGLERAVKAVRRCGNCHFVCERGPERCPSCNRKYPVPITRPGAPTEAQIAAMPGIGQISAARIASMSLRDVLPLAQTRVDLERVAVIRGYKRAWVDHVMRERQYGARRWA